MKVGALIVYFLLSSLLYSQNILHIAVCSSLNGTIDELNKKFHDTHPEIQIQTTIASSGKLAIQIEHGARYDIFLSADMSHPQSLYSNGFTKSKPVLYARGALALFSRTPRDMSRGIKLLEDKSISRIAIANPKTAPYGVATLEALKNAKILSHIKDKLVYSNSISQTLAYSTIATDAGVVALASMQQPASQKYQKNKNWVELEPALYTYTNQGMGLIKNTQTAKLFFDFMLSKDAQDILQKHGYKSND